MCVCMCVCPCVCEQGVIGSARKHSFQGDKLLLGSSGLHSVQINTSVVLKSGTHTHTHTHTHTQTVTHILMNTHTPTHNRNESLVRADRNKTHIKHPDSVFRRRTYTGFYTHTHT